MKKKIFIRFFAITLAAVLVMFAFGLVSVNLNTKNVVNERLKEETALAAALMNEQSDFAVFNQYSDNPELRITIFDLEGNPLYESDTKADLDNHADREEIQNALSGKSETVERYSETFKCDMTYYAVKTSLADGSEVILRLAVRSSEISSYIYTKAEPCWSCKHLKRSIGRSEIYYCSGEADCQYYWDNYNMESVKR